MLFSEAEKQKIRMMGIAEHDQKKASLQKLWGELKPHQQLQLTIALSPATIASISALPLELMAIVGMITNFGFGEILIATTETNGNDQPTKI